MPNEQHPKSDGTTFGDKAQNNAVVKTVQGDFVYNAAAAKLYARHQLRKPLDDFTGREKEIEELLAKLRQGGRASITGISGMSGIGKTELALIVADRLREDYPDAQLFLEMRGIDEKPLAPAEALASSIRAFEGPEVPLPDDINELKKIYLSVLSDKRALVVLDNAADQNQMRLLTPPAGCAMLVTSRNIIAGMDRITLDQLSLKEARELLISICDRITPELADQIADLCGYLPLALRAAGSMLDVMVDLDVVDYVKQLFEERTRLETIGAEGVEIGVEASFNLSYLRLDTEVARVFRALCIFPGSFDAQAEEAICEDAAHKHLSDLVKRSLVLFDKASKRYRLHDLIRVFADKCLPDKERLTKQHEHAEHYLRVLADADDLYEKGGPFIQQALTLFDSEWLNAEAGWKWARRNNITNQRALELCTLYPDVSTYISEFKLPPGERIVRRKVALAAARGLGIKESEGWHLSNLGIAYMHSGQIKRANDIFKQHLQIVRNLGDRTAEGIVLLSLGISCFELGELQQ